MHRKTFVLLTALMFSALEALPAAADPAAEREQVLRVCAGCHCLEYYITPRSRKAWELTVANMRLYAQNGARPFSEADAERVVVYMATYFDEYSNLNAAQHFAKAPEPAPAAAAPVAPAPVVTAAVAPEPVVATVVAAPVAPAPAPVVTAAVAAAVAPEPVVATVVAAPVAPAPVVAAAVAAVVAPAPVVAAAVAAVVAPVPVVATVVAAPVAPAPEPVVAAAAPQPALSEPSARINPTVSAALRERLEHPRWKPSPLLMRAAEAGGYLAVACTLLLLTSGHSRRRLGRRFRPLHSVAALGLFLGLVTHAVIYLARYGSPPVLWYGFGVASFLVLVLAQAQGLVRKRFGRVFLRIHVAAGYCGLTLVLLHWIWAWL